MQEILRLPNALSIFLFGETPFLNILFENRTLSLDEVGQKANQEQLVFRLNALRIVLIHLDDRSNDLCISDYQYFIVVDFGGFIKLGKDIVKECVYLLLGELAELFIDLYEFHKFFSSLVDDNILLL